MRLGEIRIKTVRKMITEKIVRFEVGHETHLLKDKEAYIVSTIEIEVAHGLPSYTCAISDELQQVLHGVDHRYANKTIAPDSALSYGRRVIMRVNKEEENAEGQKRNTRTGIIKVSGLSHKRAKQCDTRLAWEMLHKIHRMYSVIKNKEEMNAALLLTSMSDH